MEPYLLTIAVDEVSELYNPPVETYGTRKFCIYVTLQGQFHRFTWNKMNKPDRSIPFNEQVTLEWDPRHPTHHNRLGIELWCKRRPFFKDCVAVQWLDLDRLPLSCGTPLPLRLEGQFEKRRATMAVILIPVNFSAAVPPPPPTATTTTNYPSPSPPAPLSNNNNMNNSNGDWAPPLSSPLREDGYFPNLYADPSSSSPGAGHFSSLPVDHYMGHPIHASNNNYYTGNSNNTSNHYPHRSPISSQPPPAEFGDAALPPPVYGEVVAMDGLGDPNPLPPPLYGRR